MLWILPSMIARTLYGRTYFPLMSDVCVYNLEVSVNDSKRVRFSISFVALKTSVVFKLLK